MERSNQSCEPLIDTEINSKHYLDFHCQHCYKLITTSDEVYRIYKNAVWTYGTHNTKTERKRLYNHHKGGKPNHLLRCKGCNHFLGYHYPDGPSDREPFPLTKLFYISRNANNLFARTNIEAARKGWTVKQTQQNHITFDKRCSGGRAKPTPRGAIPGRKKFNTERKLLEKRGQRESPKALQQAREQLFIRDGEANKDLTIDLLEKEMHKMKIGKDITPLYWQTTGDPPKRIDVTKHLKGKLQLLFEKTTFTNELGIGRDALCRGHKGLTIIKVERIESKRLWSLYHTKRAFIIDLVSKRIHRPVVNVASTSPWMTEEFTLCSDICNEQMVLHGTSPETVQYILSQGFDERVSKRGLFGYGLYFAENPCKSDQYVTPDRKGNIFIFLSRVCFGTPFITTRQRSELRRPPELPNEAVKAIEPYHLADSVLAECSRTHPRGERCDLLRYREFIVYDRAQCYPEYLLTVKRVHY